MEDLLKIADRTFRSRLFVGTGKFPSNQVMREAIAASGAEMVTTALKRLNTQDCASENILDFIPKTCLLLPNTSGVRNAEEAVFAAKMNRAALGTDWLKLEIHPDPKYLLPDTRETLKATEALVKLGFKVLPYVQADPVACKQLEEMGAATVMPLAAPIGTNKGIKNEEMLRNVPVVIDAGIGAPSHAAYAMELGADACLINTAIAIADNPVEMARAFALAVQAGRTAFLAGLGVSSDLAVASSPLTAFLDELEN